MLDASRTRFVSGKEKSLGLRHKEVVLTFDDGPIAGNTPRVLKALADECVKATFFYVGQMARAYPSLVRKVVRQGHTLAHHTAAHNRLPEYKSETATKLIARGIRTVERIAYGKAGKTPRTPFFRYPYLARNKRTDAILREQGLMDFNANIDALDWKRDSPGVVHDRIMRILRREGRGIILMHDIQTRTAKMLPRLLRSLKAGGYKVVHVVPRNAPVEQPEPFMVASVQKPLEERLVSLTSQSGPVPSAKPSTIDMAAIDAMANEALAEQKSDRARDSAGNRTAVRTPNPVAKRAEDQLKRPAKRRLKLVAGLGKAPQSSKAVVLATPPKPSNNIKRAKDYRARFAAIASRTAFTVDAQNPASMVRSKTGKRSGKKKRVQFSNWKLRPSRWILR